MQGIVKRIGFVSSNNNGVNVCFMLEGNTTKYTSTSWTEMALTKVGDEVSFEPNSGFSKFLNDTNVSADSFKNLTLERELAN